MEREGLACTFASLGSRLEVAIRNQTGKDLIVDYSMLTLSAGETNLRLTGAIGKYIDLDKPKANALLPSGTTHKDEFIPVTAARLAAGEWREDWQIHTALLAPDPPLLFVPFLIEGKQILERIPLSVYSTILTADAKVEIKK